MKKKIKNNRSQFNLSLNAEETSIIKRLQNEYAVNISGCFKIFLRKYLEKLNSLKLPDIEIKK